MEQTNGEFSVDGRQLALAAALFLFFNDPIHHPLTMQPCANQHGIIAGVQAVVRLRFRVAVFDASADVTEAPGRQTLFPFSAPRGLQPRELLLLCK
jgi:hypothetical protein